MAELQVGDQILHVQHGPGRVTFVGTEYIGIRTEDDQDALIRKNSEEVLPWSEENDMIWRSMIAENERQKAIEAEQPWPESTFIFEAEDVDHYMGSHWDPFGDHASNRFIEKLPEILEASAVVKGFGDIANPPRPLPESWVKGYHLIWPHPDRGLIMTIAVDEAKQQNQFCSMFPFYPEGTGHKLTLQDVTVWDNGVEAHICASLGDPDITFYDAHYLLNRGWYERGREYAFVLTGIAYNAGPAQTTEMPYKPNPDQIAWEAVLAQERGEEPRETPATIRLDGAAFFLAISEWDVDDYSFRGPVREVKPFSDFLGQNGWLVTATIFHLEEEINLNIVITDQAWQGDAPPQIGMDIEGRLWLQGYLKDPV